MQTGGVVQSSVTVAEGVAYVGSGDGNLYAFDAETGEERWRRPTGADLPLPWGFESGDLYTSSPAWADGGGGVGSGDGRVYAVDAGSGAVRWTFRTGGRVRSSPAVAGGRVYVGSMDGTVYALELAGGREVWRFDWGWTTPAPTSTTTAPG